MHPATREYLRQIGRKGGKAKSKAKQLAARQNARKRWDGTQQVGGSEKPSGPGTSS